LGSTIIHISTPAEETLSAKGLDIHGHPVTRLDCSNIGTHLFHHTNHLMPNGYSGYRTWYATVFDMKIAKEGSIMLAYTYIEQGKFELREKPIPEIKDSRDAT